MFQAPRSSVDISFWESLHRIKLDRQRLDSPFIDITGLVRPSGERNGLNGSICVDGNSFDARAADETSCIARGAFLNVNTVEEFQRLNKKAIVDAAGRHLWKRVLDGSAVETPSELFSFVLVTFADLKRHVFTYWFAFPALVSATPFSHLLPSVRLRDTALCSKSLLSAAYFRLSSSATVDPVFVLTRVGPARPAALEDFSDLADATGASWQPMSLLEHFSGLRDSVGSADVVFVVLDAAASSASDAPGWAVRNLLALLSVWMPAECFNILCLRGQQLQGVSKYPETADHDDSVLMRISCPEGAQKAFPTPPESGAPADALTEVQSDSFLSSLAAMYASSPSASSISPKDAAIYKPPSVVGWETNDRGKPGPRVADLGAVMNSEKLMEQAVDLNVRLMRWRQWPSLDTESLGKLKCLLLGAGTLGCATARALMGWGIRHITLVDNGRVSFSNPARQSLFEFEDAENKAFKSVAAAQRLKKIFPGMVTAGHVMTILMPGHPIDPLEEASAKQSFEELRDLVASHDVIFTLTDSREARWLPSVLCAAMDKLLINSALGFSTYLVMRHGGAPTSEISPQKRRPGCYFCNDVVAPVDSMKDRSLDQQCTVTRPGLALIAGGLASELTVALMNSPHKVHHPLPAFRRADSEVSGSIDDIPHQIRGSLNDFTQTCPATPCFTHCTACSTPVVDAFKSGEYEFVRSVCSDSSILERISGITALNATIDDDLLASMEMDSEEDMLMSEDETADGGDKDV